MSLKALIIKRIEDMVAPEHHDARQLGFYRYDPVFKLLFPHIKKSKDLRSVTIDKFLEELNVLEDDKLIEIFEYVCRCYARQM